MISHEAVLNNIHRIFLMLPVCILVSLLLTFSGCGNDGGTDSHQDPAADSVEVSQCGVKIDDTAWLSFADIGNRFIDGKPLETLHYEAFAHLPILEKWRKGMDDEFSSQQIVHFLGLTFNEGEKLEKTKMKSTPSQTKFSDSYQYSMKHFAEISPLIKTFSTDGSRCRMVENMNFWLPSEVSNDSLIVAFLPNRPEIRSFENYLFVDTGVLVAGNNDQLVAQLTALRFRSMVMNYHENPAQMDGRPAFAHIFRAMMKEGIASCIAKTLETRFSMDHPVIGSYDRIPEKMFGDSRKIISILNESLPKLLTDEVLMMERGRDLVKVLITRHCIYSGGYCMSKTIIDQLGEETLRDTVGSPPAWLKAYQKAALMNPSPSPEPIEVINQWSRSMPPLDEVAFEGLLEILEATFPSS